MKTILAFLLVALLFLAQGKTAGNLRSTGLQFHNCINCSDCMNNICITCKEGYKFFNENTCVPNSYKN